MNKEVNTDSLWDKHVPIVTTTGEGGTLVTVVHLVDEIAAPREYVELISVLEAAQQGDVVVFALNTPGGRLDSTMMIIDAIGASNAVVTARLTGEVASAGTMIAMAADNIEVAQWGSMMIHNYSGGLYGKGHELQARMAFESTHLEGFFYDLYRPFLTKRECKDILAGMDLYLNADEIVGRWGVKSKKAEKKFMKEAQKAEEASQASLIEHLESQGFKVEKQ